jgi:hypothetical protein
MSWSCGTKRKRLACEPGALALDDQRHWPIAQVALSLSGLERRLAIPLTRQ